jgi:hypothetical protein
MLLVGIDEALKIILISKAALVPVALNTAKGIENVPNRYVEVARVFGFTRWQLLSRVVFPAAAAPIWNGIRYGLTHAWLALVVVELLASSEGLGFMIVYGRQLFQLDVVMAAVIVVGAVGFALDKLLARVEVRLLRDPRLGPVLSFGPSTQEGPKPSEERSIGLIDSSGGRDESAGSGDIAGRELAKLPRLASVGTNAFFLH